MSYTDINASVIDRWVEEGWQWGRPISHETYVDALHGKYDLLLTPTRPMPREWLGDVKGKRLLGLAAAGGQQMPIFCALGASCVVLDYSPRQLRSEAYVAVREGYDIDIVHGDMTKRLPFGDETFDIVFHPVSNCYIKDVGHVWQECHRILRHGGILLAGFDNYINFIVAGDDESRIVHRLPFDPLQDETLFKELQDNDCGVQFSHTLEEQVTGQLKAGFVLLDLYEDTNGEGFLHEMNIPTMIATRAVKQ